ncbi:hypothetical protein [Sphingosinithalassobacter portus]|nr:hypothetical protein [Sphingosinithalassobacter portus]|tara:strand:+ start:1092 stop:1229 length:138 start_codon:yes stop_codon:yes gene_type:complete
MTEQNEPIELDTEEARAGATPGMTRYILAISMILVIVLFAVILWR